MARKDETRAKLIQEAKDNFKRCVAWESYARKNWLDDYKFANADANNAYQWPNDVKRNREIDQRPCLTINKIRQHNLMILNDMRENKPSPKIIAVGENANKKSADIFEGVVRHIEDISNATEVYQTAANFQVQAGVGYWRILTDYVSEDSLEQEIYIRRILDPLSVYLDPDIKEQDGSDAKFGFIYENMLKTEFNTKYPKLKDAIANNDALSEDNWTDENHIRVAEYIRVVEEQDTLVLLDNGQMVRESTLKALGAGKVFKDVAAEDGAKRRTVTTKRVEWYKIAGDHILEEREMPGTYVPIIRVPGEETIIEGRMDRIGHTRAMRDPQRMYNYWSSSAVEALSLQTKTPWVAPAAAIEGYETFWGSANRTNLSVLPYNNRDDDGNEIPAPVRPPAPTVPDGYMTGMQVAATEMMMTSGQYQPQMGEPSNERSGKAINNRQRQGDRATLHYADNLAMAIRFTGRVLVQWIPLIYDTERVIRILGEDGEETTIRVDPEAQQAVAEQKNQRTAQVETIFNPTVGRYDVRIAVGPSYATRRQEAFDAMMAIMQQNPELGAMIGDLAFRNADFPGSEDLADRLKKTIPPEILGEAPPPQQQQMAAQVQQLQGLVETMTQAVAEKDMELNKIKSQTNIDAYKAESDRMKVLGAGMTPQQVLMLVQQLLQQAMTTTIEPAQELAPPTNGAGPQGMPPVGPGVLQ